MQAARRGPDLQKFTLGVGKGDVYEARDGALKLRLREPPLAVDIKEPEDKLAAGFLRARLRTGKHRDGLLAPLQAHAAGTLSIERRKERREHLVALFLAQHVHDEPKLVGGERRVPARRDTLLLPEGAARRCKPLFVDVADLVRDAEPGGRDHGLEHRLGDLRGRRVEPLLGARAVRRHQRAGPNLCAVRVSRVCRQHRRRAARAPGQLTAATAHPRARPPRPPPALPPRPPQGAPRAAAAA